MAAAAENRLIKVVEGRNVREFLDEVSAFPYGPHDDCVDALAGAHEALTGKTRGMQVFVARARIPGVADHRHDAYRNIFGEPWPRRPW